MKTLIGMAIAAGALALSACQPPPPPVEPDWVTKGCEWIDEAEYKQVREGMDLSEVEATLGKKLELISEYTIPQYRAPSITYSIYSWHQEWGTDGCSQLVYFYFEDGVHTGESAWGQVVK